MRSINKVILIGNVTRDPEIKTTGNGQSVATFTIATNRVWVTRDNRKMQSAEYHDVVAWAHLADLCKTHIRKSKLLYVEGYLKTRTWDTPEGIRKFKTEIVISDLVMLDKRSSEQSELDQDSSFESSNEVSSWDHTNDESLNSSRETESSSLKESLDSDFLSNLQI